MLKLLPLCLLTLDAGAFVMPALPARRGQIQAMRKELEATYDPMALIPLQLLVEMQAKKKKAAWDIELCSPSKINLFLRITGKRPDG